MVAASLSAFGATRTWDGGGGDEDWSNALNWSGDSLPTNTDDVIIANAGTGVARISVSPTVNSITVQSGAVLWIQSGRTLTVFAFSTVSAGGQLVVDQSTFDGNGTLTVNGHIDVYDGTLGGSGALILNSSAFMYVVAFVSSSVISRATTSAGHITFLDGGAPVPNFTFDGATLTNTGVIDIQSDHDIDPGLASPILNNSGLIIKTAGGGTAAINFTVNNAVGGTIEADSGTLALNNGGTVSGGAITGTGAVLISGNFTWSGGTITGSGPRVLNSTSVPTISCSVGNCTLNGAALQLQASATFSASSNPFVFSNGASLIIDPGKTLSITNDGSLTPGAFGGSITNNGTIWKKTAAGTSTIGVPVTMLGTSTVDLDAGTLQFGGGATVVTGATIDIAGGTTLEVTSGVFLFSSGAVSMPGSGTFKVSGGTLRVPTAITMTIANMTLQNSGVIDGGGTLILSGTSTWSGGTMGSIASPGGITRINSGNTLNIGGAAAQSLTQTRQLLNNGTVNYNSAAPNTLTMSGNARITNNGTLDLKVDSVIDLSGSALIENFGSMTKSLGAGTSNLYPRVENNAGGTVSVTTGTLDLWGGGIAAGAYAISSGSNLILAGGTFNVASTATVTGAGSLYIAFTGATLDAAAGVDLTCPNVYLQSGGTITGAGAVRVSGNFTWAGGTIAGSGPRVLNSTSTPTISCDTGNCFLDGAALQVQANSIYSASSNALVLSNGATLSIDPGKGLQITNDGNFLDGGGATSSIVIGGFASGFNAAIWKTTTSGTSVIGVPVTMHGSFDIDTGTLQLSAGVTVDANTIVDYAPGSTIEVTGGMFLFTSSLVSFPNNGDFKVTSGTLRVPTGVSVVAKNVTLQGSGVIDGGGTLILFGTTTWSGGTMGSAAAPGGLTQINSFVDILNITAGGAQSLTQNRQLLNNGTVNYAGTASNILTMSGNSKITNNNVLNLTADGTIGLSGSALIENFGSMTKSLGAGTSNLYPRVENNAGGTVSVSIGTLELWGGGIAGGAYAITSVLSLTSGTFTVASTSTVTGAGTLALNGAAADISSGANVTWPNLNLNAGTISGAGTLHVSGTFNWLAGTIAGSGPRVLNSTSAPTIACSTGNCQLDGAALQLQASATFSASSNPLVFSNGASLTIDPGKTLSITNDGNFAIGGGAASTIINNGALTKNGGTGTSALFPAVNNAGTVSATTGTLALAGGGTNTGSFTVTTPGILSFSSGTQSMSGGGSISGTGMLRFSGATATVGVPINVGTLNVTAGTAALNANGAADAFTMGGGTLGGSGTLTLNNGGTWSGGTMSGSGTTINPATKSFSIPGSVTLNGRTIQNNGTLDVSDGVIGGTGTINNIGAINDTDGATINAPMNNSGQVSTSWLLSLGGNGTHSGTFTANGPTSVIDFSGGTQTISGAFAGTGKFRFSGAAATVNGAWSGKTIDVTGGSVALNTSGTLPALTLSGGTLAGSGGLTVTGPATWSGGTIGGSGALTFDAGATVTMPGTSATTLTRPLLNQGTINFTAASSAMLIDGVAVTNSGTFDIQSSQDILASAGTPPFINNGTLKKSAGAGAMQFAAPLMNTGLVQASAGTLNFSGTYAQSAGTTDVQPGATLQTATLSLNGGTLIGNGTIAGHVDNHAVVAPGASPGTLTINGDYVQASNGVLNIQIGGTAPGTQYDQLLVSGNVTLGGTLNVITINSFVPATGNTFQILTFGALSNSSTFALIDGVDFGSGATLIPTYSTTDLQLIDTNVQADLAASVIAPPSVANGSAFAYTVNIINLGGSDATAVSFNATLPPNVTFNSASPAICSGAPNLVCTVGAVANQSAATVILNVTANGAGAAPVTVFAGGQEFDPNSANNSASASPSITGAADLRIAVTGTPSTLAGSWAFYTIAVTNSGPDVANNVSVSVAASPGLTFSANSGACTGGFPCTIGSLSSGQSATISSAWDISSTATGSVQLTVNATSSTPDPNSSNNSASATTLIGTCPAIVIDAPSEMRTGASAAATATPFGGAVYNWSISNGTIDSGDGTNIITFTAGDEGPGTLAVNVTGGGCTLSAISPITVKPRPACEGTAAPSVPADGTATADAVVTFIWTNVDGASGYRLWLQQGDAPPQSLGRTLDASVTKIIPPGAHHWYVETLFDGCASHESEHVALTILPATDCDTHGAPQLSAPANNTASTSASVAFSWDVVAKAIEYELWLAPAGGTATLIHAASETSYTATVPPGPLEWYVRAIFGGCAATESAHRTFTYTPPPECTTQSPLLIAPAEGERLTSPVSFEWRSVAGATSYELYVDGVLAATTTSSHASGIAVPLDERRWRVRARLAEGCGALDSVESTFVVIPTLPSCTPLEPPVVTAPAQISSGVPGRIQWTFVGGATDYVVQISSDAQFSPGATTTSTVTTRQLPFTFTNESSVPAARYIRVYAVDTKCIPPGKGPFSPVSVLSVVPRSGSEGVALMSDPTDVPYTLGIGGELAGLSFTAVPTTSWITVTPASGIVPPGGLTLHAFAHTAGLPPGANTGSVLITTVAAAGKVGTRGDTSTSATITLNNVAGTTTKANSTPPPDALTIPAVANVDNFFVKFQSDVSVTNTSAQEIEYQINFVPTGPSGITKGLTFNTKIASGATLALNSIVRDWLDGLTKSGTLQIRPLTPSNTSTQSAPATGLAARTTFASSRLFSVATTGGTFGQYVPVVPYANYVSRGGVISLQQIAQSDMFHTNLGLVEGSGEQVTVQVRIFDAAGTKLAGFNQDLTGGQYTQLNEVLKTHGIIALDDGRIEVEVVSGKGKVTAYASVVGNDINNDALLVPPVTIGGAGHTTWVVPSVIELTAGLNNWHTDVRIFNSGKDPAGLTLAFYSEKGGDPTTRTITLAAGEVRQLDSVLSSLFGISQDIGALHVSSAALANLVVTARAYNVVGNKTYGEFIPAVTLEETASAGSRPLQILQVEQSSKYQSNVGFAEVSGNAVTLEVKVYPPDQPVLTREVKLAPNQFLQIDSLLFAKFGLTDTHNARISVSVKSGEGRATAYLSLVDRQTGDPTYIPGQ